MKIQAHTIEVEYDELHRLKKHIAKNNGEIIWVNYYDVNGKLHREDGPAMESFVNHLYNNWYLHGVCLDCETQDQFERLVKMKAFW